MGLKPPSALKGFGEERRSLGLGNTQSVARSWKPRVQILAVASVGCVLGHNLQRFGAVSRVTSAKGPPGHCCAHLLQAKALVSLLGSDRSLAIVSGQVGCQSEQPRSLKRGTLMCPRGSRAHRKISFA